MSGLAVCATTCDVGIVSIMCIPCGHVFLEGKPFSDETDPMDSWALAKALYFHRCDIGPGPEKHARSRGKLPR